MRVDLVRSGGFANLRLQSSLDTDELPDTERQQLEGLTGHLDLADLAHRSPIGGGGADRFQYEITITDSGQSHRVIASETEAPPALKALVNHMVEKAQSSR